MDNEETKTNSAWKIGWGWYLAVPVLAVLGLAAKKGVNDTLVPKHQPALDILKERYAKGEIDRDKFEEMINDILAV